MTTLAKHEKLTSIILKDGDVITTPLSPTKLAEIFNSNEFVVIDGKGFNRYEVKTFKEYIPDSIENYLLSCDKVTRKQMQDILDERKAKGLQTNGVKHLVDIHQSRHVSIEKE